jgi:single-strand DNA-binding protein
MSGYLNRVQLIGNLGQDPEVRSTQAGKMIVTLSIATGESWNDAQSGERRERTEWHRVVIFNEGLAKIAEKYLTKGAKVLIEGKLATNKWKDSDGNDRYTTEVQVQPYNGTLTFLDSKKPDSRAAGEERAPARREPAMSGAGGSTGSGFGGGDLDDEIPFGPSWQ